MVIPLVHNKGRSKCTGRSKGRGTRAARWAARGLKQSYLYHSFFQNKPIIKICHDKSPLWLTCIGDRQPHEIDRRSVMHIHFTCSCVCKIFSLVIVIADNVPPEMSGSKEFV